MIIHYSNVHLDNRVQWIRQRAARDRYKEEIELLEEELRRLIRGFKRLGEIWSAISVRELNKGQHFRSAFAARKQKTYLAACLNAQLVASKMGVSSIP